MLRVFSPIGGTDAQRLLAMTNLAAHFSLFATDLTATFARLFHTHASSTPKILNGSNTFAKKKPVFRGIDKVSCCRKANQVWRVRCLPEPDGNSSRSVAG